MTTSIERQPQIPPELLLSELPYANDLTWFDEVASTAVDAPKPIGSIDVAEEQPLVEDSISEKSKSTFRKRAGIAVRTAVTAAELTPLNEVARLTVWGAGTGISHNNPLVSAATFGLSTLAVEGAGAVAAADLFAGQHGKRAFKWLNSKLRSVGVTEDSKLSGTTKAGFALMGGSVVAMALEQRDNPEITIEQSRRYGLFTSAWLSVVCGIGGLAGSEVISTVMDNPVEVGGGIVGTLTAVALSRSELRRNKLGKRTPDELKEWRVGYDKYGLSYGVVTDETQLEQIAVVEQDVWDEKHYGNLHDEGYDEYIAGSRSFGAFDMEGNCVGMNRMFTGRNGGELPVLDMQFDDLEVKEALIEQVVARTAEELGTVAVIPEYRSKKVNTKMWRMAYHDAVARGVKKWLIIMEPERVQNMNKHHGFTFEQLGPAVEYQGGECAPHVMDLTAVKYSLMKKHPLNYIWFFQKHLMKR